MNAPRVSVVIPTYNRAHLVGHTIDSVLAQSFPGIEIIVIDDGSRDETPAVLAAYGDRIRVLRQPNNGMNPARNAGLALARGEYVALLDSDDLWLPFKIALQVELLERFPAAGFTFSEFFILRDASGTGGARDPRGLQTWYAGGRDWAQAYPRAFRARELGLAHDAGSDFGVFAGCVFERSLHEPTVLPSTALMRRAALERHGLKLPEAEDTHGDWEFFARLSRLEGALFCDLETTLNRSHEDPVRLTRGNPRQRLARRISMISRVWRADASFMAARAADVDAVEGRLLSKLARLQLLESDAEAARVSLRRAAAIGHGRRTATEWMTFCAAHVPGSGPSLRALQRLMSGRG